MARLTGPERRRKARLRLPQTIRVRPSDAHLHDFDEILPTLNTSRDSVYFASKNAFYTEGMRLFVTCPYSDGLGSINRESLGKVREMQPANRRRNSSWRSKSSPGTPSLYRCTRDFTVGSNEPNLRTRDNQNISVETCTFSAKNAQKMRHPMSVRWPPCASSSCRRPQMSVPVAALPRVGGWSPVNQLTGHNASRRTW